MKVIGADCPLFHAPAIEARRHLCEQIASNEFPAVLASLGVAVVSFLDFVSAGPACSIFAGLHQPWNGLRSGLHDLRGKVCPRNISVSCGNSLFEAE